MSKRSLFSLSLMLSILVATAAAVSAQVSTVTIHGTVSDTNGGVIQRAQVTAVNIETNFARSVVTDSSGVYAIQFLPIGPYRLEVTANGFKKFVQSGIVLEVNRNARVDPALDAGAVSETVSVMPFRYGRGAPPIVGTAHPALTTAPLSESGTRLHSRTCEPSGEKPSVRVAGFLSSRTVPLGRL